MDDAISRVAEGLSSADDNLDFSAPLAPLATVKSYSIYSYSCIDFVSFSTQCARTFSKSSLSTQ